MDIYKVRNDKGEEWDAPEDKLSDAANDGFLPLVTDGKDTHRVSPEDMKLAAKDGFEPIAGGQKSSGLGAAMRGVAQGSTAGFADELTGAAGALLDIAPKEGEGYFDGFGNRYRASRDYARARDDEAKQQHGKIYTAGNVAGGVGSAILAGPAAATLKGSVGLGALTGLGDSEADLTKPSLGNFGTAALDTVEGAAGGALGYGAGKLAGKVWDGTKYVAKNGIGSAAKEALESVKGIPEEIKQAGKAFKIGTNDKNITGLPFVKQGEQVINGIKNIVNEVQERGATKEEFSGMADMARKALNVLRPGESGSIGSMSNDEAILSALLEDGDNAVKKWVKEKASTLYPGQVDGDEYSRLLGMGAEARNAARNFNAKEAAANLKPVVQDVQNLFENTRSQRYGQLHNAARESFEKDAAGSVFDELHGAIGDANSLKSIPSSVKGALQDVEGILTEGSGPRDYKLKPGAWGDADNGEAFNRLQQARKYLDGQINWAGKEGHSASEKILRGLRGHIDDVLKTSQDKVDADALYRASKEVEGKFFGPTEFRDANGNVDVDEFKLAKLFGNNDNAGRFKGAIKDFREFANRPDLPETFKSQAAALADQLESHAGLAEDKRALDAFRFKNGPSSPAIERMNSVANKNGLVTDAVQSPAGFLNTADQFMKSIEQRTGQKFNDMSASDKAASVKFWLWNKNNPGASPGSVETTYKKLFRL